MYWNAEETDKQHFKDCLQVRGRKMVLFPCELSWKEIELAKNICHEARTGKIKEGFHFETLLVYFFHDATILRSLQKWHNWPIYVRCRRHVL